MLMVLASGAASSGCRGQGGEQTWCPPLQPLPPTYPSPWLQVLASALRVAHPTTGALAAAWERSRGCWRSQQTASRGQGPCGCPSGGSTPSLASPIWPMYRRIQANLNWDWVRVRANRHPSLWSAALHHPRLKGITWRPASITTTRRDWLWLARRRGEVRRPPRLLHTVPPLLLPQHSGSKPDTCRYPNAHDDALLLVLRDDRPAPPSRKSR